MSFEKILIAVDDSAESLKAARSGFELAHRLKATIALVFVIDVGKEIVNPDLGMTPRESKAVLQQEAERTLAQFIRMFDGIGEVIRFMPEGVPEKEIVKIAAEWQADLIVMGTHGRRGLGRMLAGSVADHVIHHAGVPVLVMPPKME
ncbi:MAG TPA: universal stress protein [Puia sp.]|uniref:universal stress protein n=1 Tax=Puia sp. TaxID=2045100 RepID=UPI002BED4387|nr:universal stress protein [Puia sp.]HVU93678.1 universal stress protein [Puia sp.]